MRGKRCLLGQCLVSARSTRPVHARAICSRCVRRSAFRTSFANCVRSDARRRQSKSCFRRLSDIDIAHGLESSRRNHCTTSHVLSVVYATDGNKNLAAREFKAVRRCGMPHRKSVGIIGSSWHICDFRAGRTKAAIGRVEMWRGGCRLNISVAASFVWRCLMLRFTALAPITVTRKTGSKL